MRSTLLLLCICMFGCAAPAPVPAEEALVTYTVTYDMGDWPASMIRIMQCDTTSGVCDIAEPDGCRLVDEETVRGELTGHICDFTVAEGESLAFNVQLELHIEEYDTDTILIWGCDTRPEIQENLGEVHVFRGSEPTELMLDMRGEFCNFLVTPTADPLGI